MAETRRQRNLEDLRALRASLATSRARAIAVGQAQALAAIEQAIDATDHSIEWLQRELAGEGAEVRG